jgi:hypothetical protein
VCDVGLHVPLCPAYRAGAPGWAVFCVCAPVARPFMKVSLYLQEKNHVFNNDTSRYRVLYLQETF